MGDDAEYYMEKQEEERRFQEKIRQEREHQMTKDRIKREKAIESTKDNSLSKK